MTFLHLDSVVEAVGEIAHAFRAAERRLFLVGGIVRDQWLDAELGDSSDIDLTTDAQPGEIKAIVADLADALWIQGERFGTIGLRHQGRAIEITTHRNETYRNDSRKPQVDFGTDVVVDLSRRDFTVNAMAVEVPDGELVDPFGGTDHLEQRVLATPLTPEVSFSDDPLRMLRAARFMARFDLTPVPELTEAATAMRERLRIVAIERIGDEIERLLSLADPSRGLAFLASTGLLEELLEWNDHPLQPVERARLSQATLTSGALSAPWTQRLAGLLFEVYRTPEAARAACRRLRLSRDDERTIVDIVGGSQRIEAAHDDEADVIDKAVVRRWVLETRHQAQAIALASVSTAAVAAAAFAAALEDLAATEDFAALTTLDGATVMALLDVDAGPLVGEGIAMLRQHVIEQGPLPESTQRGLLVDWHAAKS